MTDDLSICFNKVFSRIVYTDSFRHPPPHTDHYYRHLLHYLQLITTHTTNATCGWGAYPHPWTSLLTSMRNRLHRRLPMSVKELKMVTESICKEVVVSWAHHSHQPFSVPLQCIVNCHVVFQRLCSRWERLRIGEVLLYAHRHQWRWSTTLMWVATFILWVTILIV